MSLNAGADVELTIEKPAAGGRMIARHDGQVVLVRGGIPGERVVARITRVERQLAFADTRAVLAASPDRREPRGDLACGGCLYGHISYARQVALKGEVIQDAFQRLGRVTLPAPLAVRPSPERGYRMRARFHVRGRRMGFFREGTHDLCDPRPTGQLSDDAIESVERAVAALSAGHDIASVELAENIAADQRIVHVTSAPGGVLPEGAMEAAVAAAGLRGCSTRTPAGALRRVGDPVVRDPLAVLTGGVAGAGLLQRHGESFFQANRFLLAHLVTAVIGAVPAEGRVLDLYAGVGLFSISLAAAGRGDVTAVEGDSSSGGDLEANAAARGGDVRVWIGRVEDYLRRQGARAATIIVDPPRTGVSRAAVQAIGAHGARRIVYVSCDPATMARDARRLLDGGYRMVSVEAFDLFPGTPHVETLGVFDRD
jgi:23S rRNA (uracil1939-C5)-methyltransferase